MTPPAFRIIVAAVLGRFGHEIVTDPSAPDLVTTKAGRKFITACATPADPTPAGMRDIARLHDAGIAANAERGFFITARSFAAGAEQYAESAPIDLIDGMRLAKALNRSRKHILLPQIYKAMCGQCGGIAQYRLGDDRAWPCATGMRSRRR
jgi:Restriction endonuclease